MNAAWVAVYSYAGPVGIVLVAIAMGCALVQEVREVARSGQGLFAEEVPPLHQEKSPLPKEGGEE